MATLTAKARNELKPSQFVFPSQRKYPIHDENHARAALQRVSQFGSSSEKSRVRAAVKKKFPAIHQQHEKDQAMSKHMNAVIRGAK